MRTQGPKVATGTQMAKADIPDNMYPFLYFLVCLRTLGLNGTVMELCWGEYVLQA